MAKAKREGGLYYTAQGVAVDAEGRKLEDAPKAPPDTDPSKQPGAAGAPAPGVMTMRLDDESLAALGGKPKAKASAATDVVAEDEPLPTVKDLPAHVSKMTSAADVKAMAKRDDRATAAPIYEARLAELEK